jgi:proteasome assembly chaperone (PAC2) family protein
VRDPGELVEFVSRADAGRPVLIEALEGFIDAGHAVRIARDHLLETLEHELVVRFDVDELLDHRARRPVMIFDADHWASYESPSLGIHLLRDTAGVPFLLLAGPEPDIQWERFVAAVLLVIEQLEVRLTVGLHSVPWAVAHTQPIGITTHGRPSDLLTTPPVAIGKVQVPASVGHLLEHRLEHLGRPGIGLAAHTPYYLAAVEYPAASEKLLVTVEEMTGLELGLGPLRERGAEVREAVDSQLSEDEQAQAVIDDLERRGDLEPESPPLQPMDFATGDELGAAFQRILADRTRRQDDEPAA